MAQVTFSGPDDERPDLGFDAYLRRTGQQRPRMAGDGVGAMVDSALAALSGGGGGGNPTSGPNGTDGLRAKLTRFNTWSPRKLALGGGGLALGGLMAALGELNNPDPMVTDGERLGGAVGAGGGSVLGGAGGAALAGFLGGGPIGALVLGSLAAAAGGAAGGGLGRNVAGIFGPSAEDKALNAQMKAAQAQTDAEKYRLQTLMPIQQEVARMAIANEAQRAALLTPIEAQRQRDAVAAQSILAAQQASNAQALAATQGLFARGII